MACITEATAGFPGLSGRSPFENGLVSEVLNELGWNTYMLGTWHLTPSEEEDLSSCRGRWPLGRGFERFYGFLGGETNLLADLVAHTPQVAEADAIDGQQLSGVVDAHALQDVQQTQISLR